MIVPAIMPKNVKDIEVHVARAKGSTQTFQLDIMDGYFVPEKTWPYFHKDFENELEDWKAIQSEDAGLPFWDEVDYELDLMVKQPERMMDQWIALGAKRIIVHLESLKDPAQTLSELQGIRTITEVGLSINNDTPLEDLLPHIEVIDCVQIMGISKIGYQGEAFDERSLEYIERLKGMYPSLTIQVDGSVNAETIQKFAEAGATRFIAGSAVYGSGDANENVRALEILVNQE